MADLSSEVLEVYAPFLSHYWLHFLSICIAFCLVNVLKSCISNSSKPTEDKHLNVLDDDAITQDSIKEEHIEDDGEHIPYLHPNNMTEAEMMRKAHDFYTFMNKRRSVRFISKEPVAYELIKTIIHTASTSPSGAHMQPWTFVVVSNTKVKNPNRDLCDYLWQRLNKRKL